MAWLKVLIETLLRKRNAQTSTVDPVDPGDIVARNGLNHSLPSDPISHEAKAEIERQKSMRGAARH